MSDLERETKVKIIAECLRILGLGLIAEMVEASEAGELKGYAEIAEMEAKKKNEAYIAEKMRLI
jgi:hypothetical protein